MKDKIALLVLGTLLIGSGIAAMFLLDGKHIWFCCVPMGLGVGVCFIGTGRRVAVDVDPKTGKFKAEVEHDKRSIDRVDDKDHTTAKASCLHRKDGVFDA